VQVSRPTCELLTRGGCGGGVINPGDIVNPGEVLNPGDFINPGIGGRFGSQYAAGDVTSEADYWAGYLAALEEIAAADEQEEGGTS